MMLQKALNKLVLQDKADIFLMSEYETDKALTLKILDIKKNESYIGQASTLELRTQAARIRLTLSDFLQEAQKALFKAGLHKQYVYCLEKDIENYTFKWKSVDDEETIINLGYVKMEKLNYEDVFNEVLVDLANNITELNDRIQEHESQLKDYRNQTSNAIKQLAEVVCIKENLEKEMYSKFLLVLNEKKKVLKEKKCQTCKSCNREKSKDVRKSKPLIEEIDELGPSTSTKRNSDLFLDDEEESIVPVRPSKMRNRKNGSKKTVENDTISYTKTVVTNNNDSDSDDFLLGNL